MKKIIISILLFIPLTTYASGVIGVAAMMIINASNNYSHYGENSYYRRSDYGYPVGVEYISSSSTVYVTGGGGAGGNDGAGAYVPILSPKAEKIYLKITNVYGRVDPYLLAEYLASIK